MGKVDEVPNGGIGWVQQCNHLSRKGYITDNYMLVPSKTHRGYLRTATSPYGRHIEEMLRLNMLFNWLLGEFGPVDDFTITRENVLNMYEDLLGFPVQGVDIIERMMVGKELKFWDHILNGDKRKNPLVQPGQK